MHSWSQAVGFINRADKIKILTKRLTTIYKVYPNNHYLRFIDRV
jgi:hypothetical protein